MDKTSITLDREPVEKLKALCQEMRPRIRFTDYVLYMIEQEIERIETTSNYSS